MIPWASAFCSLLCCHPAVCVFFLCSLSFSYLVLAHRYQLLMLQSKPKDQNLRIKINSAIWLNQSHFQFIFIGDWAREKKSKTKSLVSEGKMTLVSLVRLLILRMWLQMTSFHISFKQFQIERSTKLNWLPTIPWFCWRNALFIVNRRFTKALWIVEKQYRYINELCISAC